ncbi:MAG: DUF2628 domain-containing protein [Proteobacteria bacterium]|nr:DUF2628 domain-containing protein [Pseudomonadota bacterium]
MRVFTAHLRPGAPPTLVREGFAWGALLFGGLWLLAHRAWIAGAIALAAAVLIAVLVPAPARGILEVGLAVGLGFSGWDLVRVALARRGYALAHVVAAPDADAALLRLLTLRPELGAAFVPAGGLR